MNLFSTSKAFNLSMEFKLIINKRDMITHEKMKVLSTLDEIYQQNATEQKHKLRVQAIQEIVNSEIKYLQQLEIIMEFFMKPILDKKLLNYNSYTTLFENIETLYNVNIELLKELKENPENIAKAFYKLAPFFKLYSVYAYNYKCASTILQEIQKNDSMAAKFISNQETRPEVSNKLSSLLITPIQRVPRYKLLLKEVLSHTTSKQQDYTLLQASLLEIEKVAMHINLLVAEYEDTEKLLQLQKHIVGHISLTKPGRKLIHQGPLMRVSRRGNTSFRRHFILLSDTLLYCKGNPKSLTVCCLLPLNKCKIERVLSHGLFKVVCMQETLLLYSENGDSEAWIETLQTAVKKYIKSRETLRKESSSRIPTRKMIYFQKDFIKKRCKKKRPLFVDEAIKVTLFQSGNMFVKNIQSIGENAMNINCTVQANLKRSSSAPMINEISTAMSISSPSTTAPPRDTITLSNGFSNISRARRFSTSSPGSSIGIGIGPKLTPRVNQLRREECIDVVAGREVAHEKEIHSAMQISQSWEDLTFETEGLSFKDSSTDSPSPSNLLTTSAVLPQSRIDKQLMPKKIFDPLNLNLSSVGSPLYTSLSPTRTSLGQRQCYSPSLQAVAWKNGSLSPSPTRKAFATRRSLSPISIRPSCLGATGGTLKRKFELDESIGMDCLIQPPIKRAFNLLMSNPLRASSTGSIGTPESLSSADSPNFSNQLVDESNLSSSRTLVQNYDISISNINSNSQQIKSTETNLMNIQESSCGNDNR